MGDKVICGAAADDCWIPATIKYFWPIDEIENQGLRLPAAAGELVPHYKCGKPFRDDYSSVAAPRDADDCIRLGRLRFDSKRGIMLRSIQ